ncbi:MAG: DUF4843 domain-containing protein [Odoribacteraceae bacterium]|jgi:hypothetical protein|nr:DUF4843 domain-containing protein [Odoribacteraceae bacterium]
MKHAYIILAIAFAACRQNETATFPDEGAIYFFEQEDSGYGTMLAAAEKNFSFAILDDTVTRAEGKVNVRLLGKVSGEPRAFRARVVPDSTTAIEGTHYRLHDGILAPGELESYLPLTLYRAPDLKQAAVNIYLEIVPTEDLAVGLTHGQFFMLHVGDFFMKPATWTMYVDQYFGTYCDNKYKFIIDVLGITEYPMTRGNVPPVDGSYTPPQMQGFQYALVTAYEQYRKTNPPIWVDDNAEPKVEIKFKP